MKQNNFDLYEDQYEIQSLQQSLNLKKQRFDLAKKEFFKNYFENIRDDYLSILPISAKQFINYSKFEFKKSDDGNIYWVAKGHRISIKNGSAVYGHAVDEIYQGQFETLSPTIQQLTIKQAEDYDKSIFPISPRVVNGCDFSAIGYILFEKENWQLVWRQGATAYIDRAIGSKTASSALQLIYSGKEHSEHRSSWEKIKPHVEKIKERNYSYVPSYLELLEGGKFSANLITNNQESIDLIFGEGTSQTIIDKINIQQKNKQETRKKLKL